MPPVNNAFPESSLCKSIALGLIWNQYLWYEAWIRLATAIVNFDILPSKYIHLQFPTV